MDIQRTSIPEMLTGAGAVGVARIQLPSFRVVKSVKLRAASGNAGLIYLGGPSVAVGAGYQLAAGERVEIPIDDLSKIHLIASQASQGYAWQLS